MRAEQIRFHRPPTAALFAALDQAELTTTSEEQTADLPALKVERTETLRLKVKAQGSALAEWFATPMIRGSHVLALVASGTLFGVALSPLVFVGLSGLVEVLGL